MKTIRIALAPTTRSDLLCVCCGQFLVREKGFALVAPSQNDARAEAGIHKRCLHVIKAASTRRPKARNASEEAHA